MKKPFSAYDGDEAYIFICYAHKDADVVYPEILWLHKQGINVWYDEGISPGAEFPERLGNAILGASLVFFYASPESAHSRHCRDEVFFALDRDTPVLTAYISATELPPGLALSTGTAQALMRHELPQHDYRKKLLQGIATLSQSGKTIETDPSSVDSESTRLLVKRVAMLFAAAAGVGALVLAGLGVQQYLERQEQVRFAKDELIPKIAELLDVQWRDYTEPYALAVQAEEIIPGDPELNALIDRISLNIDIDTDPVGAEVYIRDYDHPEYEWQHLGQTPLSDVRMPVGVFRWKLEKEGYETVLAAASSWDISISGKDLLVPSNFSRKLDKIDEIPAGMVRVAGAQTPFGTIGDFFIDRFEVTNTDYLKFVTAGGYRNRDYWKHEFVTDDDTISWADAMSGFVDQSGRTGPSTWIGGNYPDGMAEHPVSGVSWYEAAAYAEFVGRSLPTGPHWGVARGEYSPLIKFPQLGGFAIFAPFSNFDGDQTVAVGSLPGVTAFGAYDLAGNVREWCSNDTAMGKLVRGGARGDNPYRFAEPGQAPPMLRSDGYGFRTVYYPDGDNNPAQAFSAESIFPQRDISNQAIVSDEVFAAYRSQFEYDHTDLNVTQESVRSGSEMWTLERVSVDAPYGDERMIVNMFLPKNASPPYQTVVYVPGSAALFHASSENLDEYYEFPIFLSFLVKSGRAVVFPVYRGTFERRDDRLTMMHLGDSTRAYVDFLTQVVKDFRRTIDYLETRSDIDADKLAYYGMSWGGLLGSIIPAIETRPKTAILLAAGLMPTGRPESDPVNYVPRIEMPVLMMVGRYDSIISHRDAAIPMFDLLATPEDQKLLKVYETDHIPPKSEYVAEILAWLDLYLGPVGQSGALTTAALPSAPPQ